MEEAARARREGRLDDACRGYAEAAALSRSGRDRRCLIRALKGAGQIERDRGNLGAALAAYREAAALAREEGDPSLLAHTIRHVGDVLRQLRRIAEAEACVIRRR
jgi:tetratricopeptide (TPR) repeat protein